MRNRALKRRYFNYDLYFVNDKEETKGSERKEHMAKPVYPLIQVLEIKKKRVDDAEKVVKEKTRILEKENEILAKVQAKRDAVAKHYDDKLAQLRDGLDEGVSTIKIQQMKTYLKVVKEDLIREDKKVEAQTAQVELAEKNLEAAKQILRDRRQEVDKLNMHQEEWEKKMLKELKKKEAKTQDEIGSTMYLSNKKKNKELQDKSSKKKKIT